MTTGAAATYASASTATAPVSCPGGSPRPAWPSGRPSWTRSPHPPPHPPTTTPPARPDPRTPGQRRHDGLLDAGLRLLRSGTLPDCGGVAATVHITLTEQHLRERAGLAPTGHDGLISIPEALTLAAEADLIPVVLTDTGGITAYGRTRRTATPAQRRALAARDRGCSFPGCTAPPAWTHAHHITAWALGGRTDLDNLTLLCGHHHREHQHLGWTCTMINGTPHWTPPTWIDPHQKPRRNHVNHVGVP